LLFVGERSPEQDKSAGSGFERCAATARRVAGRTPAINCQASNKKNPVPESAGFLLCGVYLPGGAALTGATDRSPPAGKSRYITSSPHHLITFIQSHIKPRRCNHFAIIHFFTAHVLTLIAKTGVTKKNVNTITYK
ncbi:hypothetical protein, partial [Klebsiella aerogenes]|uniref:hypothetical protein n=1 Tax=Klebsiella aerogenes TaxID=548 RepID=UPI003979509D